MASASVTITNPHGTRKAAANLMALDDRIKRALTFDLHGRLVMATPVDTGRARGNWVPSAVYPFPGVKDAPASAPSKGSPPTAEELGDVRPHLIESVAYWVSNNLPYIRSLNEGHSKQAPAGFADAALNATRTYADRIMRTIVGRAR